MNTPKCNFYRRQLSDPKSIALGVGPECAEKRTTFVSGCGTSDSEVSELSSVNDIEVQKWI